jgi:hypothetical protein
LIRRSTDDRTFVSDGCIRREIIVQALPISMSRGGRWLGVLRIIERHPVAWLGAGVLCLVLSHSDWAVQLGFVAARPTGAFDATIQFALFVIGSGLCGLGLFGLFAKLVSTTPWSARAFFAVWLGVVSYRCATDLGVWGFGNEARDEPFKSFAYDWNPVGRDTYSLGVRVGPLLHACPGDSAVFAVALVRDRTRSLDDEPLIAATGVHRLDNAGDAVLSMSMDCGAPSEVTLGTDVRTVLFSAPSGRSTELQALLRRTYAAAGNESAVVPLKLGELTSLNWLRCWGYREARAVPILKSAETILALAAGLDDRERERLRLMLAPEEFTTSLTRVSGRRSSVRSR